MLEDVVDKMREQSEKGSKDRLCKVVWWCDWIAVRIICLSIFSLIGSAAIAGVIQLIKLLYS